MFFSSSTMLLSGFSLSLSLSLPPLSWSSWLSLLLFQCESLQLSGPPGHPGYNGTQGPAGPFGLSGVQGPRGPSGFNGIQGPLGLGASSCVFNTLSSTGMAANSIAQQEITATEPDVIWVEDCESCLILTKNVLLKIALRHISTWDNIYRSKELSKCRKASLKVIKLSYYFLAIGRIDWRIKANFLSFKF